MLFVKKIVTFAVTMPTTSEKQIAKLCHAVECSLGKPMRTPKDFNLLSSRIYARLHVQISTTTLKRLWGYLSSESQPRESTLSILSRFLGYQGWEDYCLQAGCAKEQQSQMVMNRHLSVAESLREGDRLRLTWLPDRTCDILYEGGLSFRVMGSSNTRLRTGNTFRCSLIIEGEPLYLDTLRQDQTPPAIYVTDLPD